MNALDIIGLGDNPKLSILQFDNEDDWLELRKKGIGGSDAGAILGLNKYNSPLSVYKAKVDGIVKDMSDNANVKRGKELEDFIMTKYVQPKMKEYGYTAEKPEFMIVNSEYPYLRANLDGIAKSMTKSSYETSILIEIKCVSTFAEDAWDGPDYCGIPPYYYAQMQHYMAVTGMRAGYLVALFDRTWTVKWYPVKRDDAFIGKMLKALKEFYEVNMCMQIPPKIVYSMDKEEAIAAIKDTITAVRDSMAPQTESAEMTELVAKYKDINKSMKDLEKQKDVVASELLAMHKSGFKPSVGKVSFNVTTSHKFNSTRFKTEHPDMYEEYCEDVESPRLTVK